jgi:hypothetical protein
LPNKLFNSEILDKSFKHWHDTCLWRVSMAKKPKTAEEEKKKKAYYSKKEKKAAEVKKK